MFVQVSASDPTLLQGKGSGNNLSAFLFMPSQLSYKYSWEPIKMQIYLRSGQP